MHYLRPSFTLPAAPQRTSQQQWDLAILSKAEYIAKHKITAAAYDKLTQ